MNKFFKKLMTLFTIALLLPLFACTQNEISNIVLDPGHGGTSPGCNYEYDGKIIKEEQLNYKIALFMQQELKKYKTKSGKNINVYITRGENENPSIQKRIDIGVKKKADIIISLHVNASRPHSLGKYRGAMVLVTSSNFNGLKKKEEDLAKSILGQLRKSGVNTQCDDTIDNKATNKNGLLSRLSDDGSTYPNGDTTDWYGIVMRGVIQKIVSILIEHAYLDNEQDYRECLSSDEKLSELAKSDVRGIAQYYELVMKD